MATRQDRLMVRMKKDHELDEKVQKLYFYMKGNGYKFSHQNNEEASSSDSEESS